ncbi:MAG: sensor histidine kinase [Trueperaceae bacterium]
MNDPPAGRAGPVAHVRLDGPAGHRNLELETLLELSRALEGAPTGFEAAALALRTLVAEGRFAAGEVWWRAEDGPRWRTIDAGADGDRPDAVIVDGVMASGAPRRVEGWWLIPVASEGVLGLGGGPDVSGSFLLGVAEVVTATAQGGHLRRSLEEKEAQRSRLLRALLTAQEEERGRIARDLHDQIGQSLTAMLLGLDRQLERLDPSGDGAHGELRRLRGLTAVTLADVRRIALDLRPSVLDELGLAAALRRFARELHERYGIAVTVLVEVPERLSRQVETVLYRVAQEALTNVVRHAQAAEASIVVTVSRGSVQLVVEDDGVGFDPAALAPAERIGLIGMRERLELLGGSLRLESAPGSGCSVHGRLPLP